MQDRFFDPTPYGRIPPLSLSAAVVLARALVSVALDNLSGLPQRALLRMGRAADDADAALLARRQALGAASASGVEIDTRADRVIAGLRMRLDAYALLPQDEHPLSPRAAALSEQLFPEGLGFLKQPYVEQLGAMQTLLQHIDDDQLTTELDAICGAEFLHSLRTVLPRYRGMVEALLSQERPVVETARGPFPLRAEPCGRIRDRAGLRARLERRQHEAGLGQHHPDVHGLA